MICIVDTHALVWFLEGNKRLSAVAQAALADPHNQLVLPTLVLAEANHLYSRKRISVSASRMLSEVANAENCTVYPLDENVAMRVSGELDIHDAIIVATALVYRELSTDTVVVVTRDEAIIRSGLVQTIW